MSMYYGTQIKKMRTQKGLSQMDLAKRAGLSQPSICDIENGITKKIYVDTAYRIAIVLGLTVDALFFCDTNEKE